MDANSALGKKLEEWRKAQAKMAEHNVKQNEKAKKAKANPAKKAKLGVSEALAGAKQRAAVPLPKQIKDALDALLKARDPLAADELSRRCSHDAAPDTQLYAELSSHLRVTKHADGRLQYKARNEASDRESLLGLIKGDATGKRLKELEDAYTGAADDVKTLAVEGLVYLLPGEAKDEPTVFWADPEPEIKVTPDIVAMWHDIEVPEDPEELQRELRSAGLHSAEQTGVRKRAAPPPREKKKREYNYSRAKLTNVHLPELFMGDAPGA